MRYINVVIGQLLSVCYLFNMIPYSYNYVAMFDWYAYILFLNCMLLSTLIFCCSASAATQIPDGSS